MINQKSISKVWVVFSYLLIALIAMVSISFFDTHQLVTAESQYSSQHSVNSKLLLTPTLNPLPLAGKKMALSAGHGRYERNGSWLWQRGEYWGIREDLVNAEIVMYLGQYLSEQGATVIHLREPDKNAPAGASGLPRWQEASRHYLQYLGLPASVWDRASCNAHSTPGLCKDWFARPLGANHYQADLLIGLHNNGGRGTGTETFYDTTGDYHDPAQAAALAQSVHPLLINSIRSEYNGGWVDRGIKPRAGTYVENRYAEMPAILIEAAFMDTQSPDNDALHDETFKQLVAQAIVAGVCDYYNVSCTGGTPPTPTPTLTPIPPPPTGNTYLPIYPVSQTGGELNVGWEVPACDNFNNATFYTIPGLQTTFTTTGNSLLELSFAGLGRNSNNMGSIYSAFFVDGQKINTAFGHEQLGGCRNSGTTDGDWTSCNMSNRATATVGAGEHTVEVKVKCDPVSTTEARVWNGWLVVKDHAE